MRMLTFTALLLGLAAPLTAAVPLQPAWAEQPGQPALEDPGRLENRYYCRLILPSGDGINMWYVEASRTTTEGRPYPMGAHTHGRMAPYREMHRPADFRRYPFDAGQWSEGYGVRFAYDLWVAEDEVSMKTWQTIRGGKPSAWPSTFTDADNDGLDDATGFVRYDWNPASEDPVAFVTWTEAEAFTADLAASLPLGTHQLALPSEAEWEFAARAFEVPAAGQRWPLMIDAWSWGGVSNGQLRGEVTVDEAAVDAAITAGSIVDGGEYPAGSTDAGDGWADVGGVGVEGSRYVAYRDTLIGSWINDQRHLLYEGIGARWEARWPGDDSPYVPGSVAQLYRVTDISGAGASRTMDLEVVRVTYRPYNAWGLSHIGGNVAEWVADRWDGASPYNTLGAGRNLASEVGDPAIAARMPDLHGSISDPADGHAANSVGSYRVTRGGSWLNGERDCRPSSRGFADPRTANDQIGFRFVVRAVP